HTPAEHLIGLRASDRAFQVYESLVPAERLLRGSLLTAQHLGCDGRVERRGDVFGKQRRLIEAAAAQSMPRQWDGDDHVGLEWPCGDHFAQELAHERCEVTA